MKNFLLTATFSITILTLFFAPSATNLAFAGGQNQQCLDDCSFEEFLCNINQGQNCAADRILCEAACPILECFTGLDCGPLTQCSGFTCLPPGICQQIFFDGNQCGFNDACETNVCSGGACVQELEDCNDGDACTIDSCDRASGCQTAPNPDPVCAEVGGVIVPLENTSLLVAGAQSFSWMIPVVLSVLGIGLFVVSRKSE